jgi:hypothetical protein
MSLFRIERRVGRLVEARVFGLQSADDVEAYKRGFPPSMMASITGPVLCADHRPVFIYNQRVADLLVDLFKTMNTMWVRVAIVIAPSNATLAMQLQRIVRASNNPSRKLFFEASDAREFLSEILSREEDARVAAFLDEPFQRAKPARGP